MTFSLGSTPRSLVKYNDQSISAITEVGSGAGITDDMVLIKEQTASSSSTVDFVDGTSDVVLDSTYPIYLFKFINIHPATDDVFFGHQGDVDGATTYGQTCTNAVFYARHEEDDSPADMDYYASADQAQGTGINQMVQLGNDNDQAGSGYLHIFNPSSTTFVKHFISRFNGAHPSDNSMSIFSAGYYNTTSALNTFRFKMSSGNIDAGTFKMYGIKDS